MEDGCCTAISQVIILHGCPKVGIFQGKVINWCKSLECLGELQTRTGINATYPRSL